ncbi:YbaN family protein [Konateibacter massiliensis]|uniref:YbaN family protein n=1 Tax=Konateibacter massiliensis TaxID=2002841 RepID=UPI000C153F31|nr:YbaN family protein [Konateibacter massiliensis]
MEIKNKILIAIGFMFLLIGGIGLFLPVLPTTPFVLVAAACFSSNKKLTDWLKKSKLFGEYITNYKERKGLSTITVIKSLSFLWIMLIISIVYIHSMWAAILLPCIGIAVTTHILIIARPKEKGSSQKELGAEGD